ncbi:hypothetical protein [Halobacteriovorax sp. CON-3]|uniref:RHS repeat domain-containing protein n=1 Tax=Halobacteriovorax sp. CON-3 TaxID=3157710 RepID=UPI0037203833
MFKILTLILMITFNSYGFVSTENSNENQMQLFDQASSTGDAIVGFQIPIQKRTEYIRQNIGFNYNSRFQNNLGYGVGFTIDLPYLEKKQGREGYTHILHDKGQTSYFNSSDGSELFHNTFAKLESHSGVLNYRNLKGNKLTYPNGDIKLFDVNTGKLIYERSFYVGHEIYYKWDQSLLLEITYNTVKINFNYEDCELFSSQKYRSIPFVYAGVLSQSRKCLKTVAYDVDESQRNFISGRQDIKKAINFRYDQGYLISAGWDRFVVNKHFYDNVFFTGTYESFSSDDVYNRYSCVTDKQVYDESELLDGKYEYKRVTGNDILAIVPGRKAKVYTRKELFRLLNVKSIDEYTKGEINHGIILPVQHNDDGITDFITIETKDAWRTSIYVSLGIFGKNGYEVGDKKLLFEDYDYFDIGQVKYQYPGDRRLVEDASLIPVNINSDGYTDYLLCNSQRKGEVFLSYFSNSEVQYTRREIGFICSRGTIVTDVNRDGVSDLVTDNKFYVGNGGNAESFYSYSDLNYKLKLEDYFKLREKNQLDNINEFVSVNYSQISGEVGFRRQEVLRRLQNDLNKFKKEFRNNNIRFGEHGIPYAAGHGATVAYDIDGDGVFEIYNGHGGYKKCNYVPTLKLLKNYKLRNKANWSLDYTSKNGRFTLSKMKNVDSKLEFLFSYEGQLSSKFRKRFESFRSVKTKVSNGNKSKFFFKEFAQIDIGPKFETYNAYSSQCLKQPCDGISSFEGSYNTVNKVSISFNNKPYFYNELSILGRSSKEGKTYEKVETKLENLELKDWGIRKYKKVIKQIRNEDIKEFTLSQLFNSINGKVYLVESIEADPLRLATPQICTNYSIRRNNLEMITKKVSLCDDKVLLNEVTKRNSLGEVESVFDGTIKVETKKSVESGLLKYTTITTDRNKQPVDKIEDLYNNYGDRYITRSYDLGCGLDCLYEMERFSYNDFSELADSMTDDKTTYYYQKQHGQLFSRQQTLIYSDDAQESSHLFIGTNRQKNYLDSLITKKSKVVTDLYGNETQSYDFYHENLVLNGIFEFDEFGEKKKFYFDGYNLETKKRQVFPLREYTNDSLGRVLNIENVERNENEVFNYVENRSIKKLPSAKEFEVSTGLKNEEYKLKHDNGTFQRSYLINGLVSSYDKFTYGYDIFDKPSLAYYDGALIYEANRTKYETKHNNFIEKIDHEMRIYEFNGANNNVEYTYDAVGNLTSFQAGAEFSVKSQFKHNFKLRSEISNNEQNFKMSFKYDALGNNRFFVMDNSKSYQSCFSERRLSRIVSPISWSNQEYSICKDQYAKKDTYLTFVDGIKYDGRAKMTELMIDDRKTLLKWSYGPEFRIEKIENNFFYETYSYNEDNLIVSRITKFSDGSSKSEKYNYDGANKLITSLKPSIQRDELGRIKEYNNLKIKFNKNSPVSIDEKSISYSRYGDILGVGNEYYYEKDTHLIGDALVRYIYNDGRLIGAFVVKETGHRRRPYKEEYFHILTDWRHSVRAIMNDRGEMLSYFDYSAYGDLTETVVKKSENAQYIRYRFAGMVMPRGAKNYYVSDSRIYLSELGEWANLDYMSILSPKTFSGINLDDGNGVRYSNGDPVNFIDPTGFNAIEASRPVDIPIIGNLTAHRVLFVGQPGSDTLTKIDLVPKTTGEVLLSAIGAPVRGEIRIKEVSRNSLKGYSIDKTHVGNKAFDKAILDKASELQGNFDNFDRMYHVLGAFSETGFQNCIGVRRELVDQAVDRENVKSH